jgi:kynurenine formamidase
MAGFLDIEEHQIGLDGIVLQPDTAAGKRYGQPNFVASGCGMGYEATMYLLERGIRLTGTDAWSWDAPFVHTAKKYEETKDASLIWEGHKAGRDIGYCHLEKLHNLEVLPPFGFYISCSQNSGCICGVDQGGGYF